MEKQPEFHQWFGPLLDALREIGDSGRPSDVSEHIAKSLGLPNKQLDLIQTQVTRASSYLAREGLLNEDNGVWSLTEKGRNAHLSDKEASDIFLKRELCTKQFTREMNLDSLSALYWISCIVSPIVFAIAWRNPWHLLQVAYLPLAFIIATIVFNFSPAPMSLSVLILLVPITWIYRLIPHPSWYIGVIPLQLILFWYVQRYLPRLKQQEWVEFSQNTGISLEKVYESLR